MSGHNYVDYRKGCRCFTCRMAKSVYEHRRRSGLLAGYVDSGPSREHLSALRAAGYGLRRIMDTTGVSRSALRRVSMQETVHATTAARLLSMPVTEAPKPQRFLPAVGTHRRMQALCTLGWSPRSQIQRAGLARCGSTRLLAVEKVWPRTAEKISTLYEQLSMTVPPPSKSATRARHRAAAERFFPPLAWEEESLDDPDALPCLVPPVEPVDRDLELLVQHLAAGHDVRPTPASTREIVRRLPDRAVGELAALARCNPETVRRYRKELATC